MASAHRTVAGLRHRVERGGSLDVGARQLVRRGRRSWRGGKSSATATSLSSALCSASLALPQLLILFTKLIWTSCLCTVA